MAVDWNVGDHLVDVCWKDADGVDGQHYTREFANLRNQQSRAAQQLAPPGKDRHRVGGRYPCRHDRDKFVGDRQMQYARQIIEPHHDEA